MCHVDVTGVHLISIHAPINGYAHGRQDFNSRPSARGDFNRRKSRQSKCISIHAPLRGATISALCFTMPRCISIPAPPRGATRGVRNSLGDKIFQFPPLREGRPVVDALSVLSIHFNSRPSARGDKPFLLPLPSPRHFNSRPSARGDSKRYAISANLLSNPHKLPRFSSRAM